MDKLIAAARELAVEVKEKATALARNVAERVESFFCTGKQATRAEGVADREQEQARAPSPSLKAQLDRQLAALDQRLAFEASLPDRLAALDRRMDAQAKAQEAQELSLKQQSLSPQAPEKEQENEHEEEHEIKHGYGLGIGR